MTMAETMADVTGGLGAALPDLMPELIPVLPPPQRHLLAALSAHFGGRTLPVPAADPDWTAVFELARHHRLAPLLAGAIPPETPLGTGGGPTVLDWQREVARQSLLATARMLAITRHFEKSGIDLLVLKGPAQAMLLFGNAQARSCRDIDLLVRPAQKEAAIALLRGLGYGTRPDLLARHVNAIFLASETGGPPVELHTQLSEGDIAFPGRVLDPFRHSGEVTINGRTVRTLSPGATIAYAAHHAARHHWSRLYWLADLMAATRRPAADWEEAVVFAKQGGAERHLAMAVRLVAGLTGLAPPVAVPCPRRDVPILRRAERITGAIWALPPMSENEALRRVGKLRVMRSDMALYSHPRAALRHLLALLRPTESDSMGVRLPAPLMPVLMPMLLPFRIIRVLTARLVRRIRTPGRVL
ncbi:nucleotidyltransferase family protein [Azospirillum sp. B2RO_4]|uniref:nucleotidyltransferase family protein n=1 Tax=Azospirillum sp. B2RO_4 TaxID=3027796 RepID=UPI003DA85A62